MYNIYKIFQIYSKYIWLAVCYIHTQRIHRCSNICIFRNYPFMDFALTLAIFFQGVSYSFSPNFNK